MGPHFDQGRGCIINLHVASHSRAERGSAVKTRPLNMEGEKVVAAAASADDIMVHAYPV